MYYHIVIEKKPEFKGEKPISANVYDLSKEIMISRYAIPYFDNKNFIACGYTLNKSNVNRFQIVATERKCDEIAKEVTEDNYKNNFFYTWGKEDVVTSDEYSKDVTMDILEEINKTNDEKSKLDASSKIKKMSKSVFIVHGHDHNKVTEVENFIRSIGYNPIVLFKEIDGGKTIIEKIEENVEKAIYGIVIYSKCDVGYEVDCEDRKKYRARQNVVFEHGYLIAKLGRANVCAVLTDDDIECPGDISGVIYKKFDSNGFWKYDIAKEMQAQGIYIDFNMIR